MTDGAGFAEQPGQEHDYHAEWKAFAHRRNLALTLLFGLVPVCVLLFLVSRVYLHQPLFCLAIMLLWCCATVWAVWRAGEFRCPRCRRRYAALGHGKGTNLTRGLFDRICSNCKLTKFERVR